jgi:hypothetical protein
MDKDKKFALLVIGVPFLGLIYCGIILATLLYSEWAREHPIIVAAVFTLAPSLISGLIWLNGAIKNQNKQKATLTSSD